MNEQNIATERWIIVYQFTKKFMENQNNACKA